MIKDKTKHWKVYMHISKIDGKAYCGITSKTLRTRFGINGAGYKTCTRFYEAIQRDGWDNFDHVLIMPDGTREEAEFLEQSIIKACHLTDFNRGYNTFDGSIDGIPISDTARSQLRMFYNLQRYFSPRGIELYDGSGKKLKSFEAIVDCASYLNCKDHEVAEHAVPFGSRMKCGLFVRYSDKYSDVEQLSKDEMIEYRSHPTCRKKVNQYDLTGKYLHTFDSVCIAAEETGLGREAISRALQMKHPVNSGGFQWKYFDNNIDDIPPYVRGKAAPHVAVHKYVYKLNPSNDQIIKKYFSVTEASLENDISRNSIQKAFKSDTHLSKGYKWIEAKDFDSAPEED